MALSDQKPCSLLVYPGPHGGEGAPSQDAIRRQLESKDDEVKVRAMKETICQLIAGEKLPKLLMPVIKYCLHSENHTLKKLMLLYWEVVDKTNQDGSLLPEMILVCNALKNNLVHANEYIRGSTLRFLTHLKEHEILESLIPSITANLEHRHSYVRKNAALAVYSVATSCPDLVPDASEMVEKFIYAEANASARRNAFVMLTRCDMERAVRYLGTVLDTIGTTGEAFQLAALGLIRSASRSHPQLRAGYLRSVYGLTNSASSNAVAYEAANTLLALSALPTAVRAAVAAYARLLTAESDHNIKLVILGRLAALRRRHEKVLQEQVMDILRVLSTPSVDIRRKVLALALDLLTQRNAEDVTQLLKKELAKADQSGRRQKQAKGGEYRKLLVESLHKCAVRFPDLVGGVVATLVNYVGDEDSQAALDVLYFLRETAAQFESRRAGIVARLAESFDEIRDPQVYSVALWVLGEFATDDESVASALAAVHRSVGPVPLLPPRPGAAAAAAAEKAEEEAADALTPAASVSRPVVLADGTYAQQSSAAAAPTAAAAAASPGGGGGENTLRDVLVGKGDYFVATAVANTLTKLLLRRRERGGNSPEVNAEVARGLLLMASILRLGTDRRSPHPIDRDSQLRLNVCMHALLNPGQACDVFLRQSRAAFVRMLEAQRDHSLGEGGGEAARKKKGDDAPRKQADDLISIRQLRPGGGGGGGGGWDDDEDGDGALQADDADVLDLAGAVAPPKAADVADGRLTRVFQLTGYGDAVYAEAHVVVLEYDVLVELLLVNQTDQTLQNVQVEISTSRDLKLVDRPPAHSIAAYDYLTVSCSIKVSSTESGTIFGNIVYGSASGVDSTVIALNTIHMDIADYIKPVYCTDRAFRASWAELEWENKLSVTTDLTDLNEYLQHILGITNMALLTRDAALSGSCGFLAANLHAHSIFGEPALLNMSVQRHAATGKIVGVLRIRCRSQGIALSLGDKVTHCQGGGGKK